MRALTVVLGAALLALASTAHAEGPRPAPVPALSAPKPAVRAPIAFVAPTAPLAKAPTVTTIHLHADAHVSAPKVETAPNAAKKPAAPAAAVPLFPVEHIVTTDGASLKSFLAGSHTPAAPARSAPSADVKKLAAGVHLLMEDGPGAYERVLVTPTYVALVRKTGIVDLIPKGDAEAQIASGQQMTKHRLEVGIGPKGRPVFGEEGPAGTVRLYRQLPKAANGDLVTPEGFTSFALTESDAYHPFGEAGKTVTLAIPRAMFDRAHAGEIGGTGWAGGGGIGIDVVEEMQIDSRVLKAHLEPLTK